MINVYFDRIFSVVSLGLQEFQFTTMSVKQDCENDWNLLQTWYMLPSIAINEFFLIHIHLCTKFRDLWFSSSSLFFSSSYDKKVREVSYHFSISNKKKIHVCLCNICCLMLTDSFSIKNHNHQATWVISVSRIRTLMKKWSRKQFDFRIWTFLHLISAQKDFLYDRYMAPRQLLTKMPNWHYIY